MARVYETAVMLLLLSLLVLGIVWVASALLHHNTARESLYGEGCNEMLDTHIYPEKFKINLQV